MKKVLDNFIWQGINQLGIDSKIPIEEMQSHVIYNRIVAITLMTYLTFIPISGIMESVMYSSILLISTGLIVLCLWINTKSYFILSKVVFMTTIIGSLSTISVIMKPETGFFLGLVPVSILPLLFVRNKWVAIIPLFSCILIFILIEYLWSVIEPIQLQDWKVSFMMFSIIYGSIIVGFFYNDFFRKTSDETDAKMIFINKQISNRNKIILKNVQLASEIQVNLLPDDDHLERLFPESFVLYKPRDIVSGDFYWVESKEGLRYLAVVDCTGHGIPGAFVSILGHQALNRAINNLGLRQPAEILNKLHELMYNVMRKEDNNILDGMDMALIVVDQVKGKWSFSGAQSNVLLVRDFDNSISDVEPEFRGINRLMYKIDGQKQSIGSEYLKEEFIQRDFEIKENDILYLYTDGYVDQFGGPHSKKLKHIPMRKLILEIQDLKFDYQKEAVLSYFEKWQGEENQIDDVCVIGLRLS